MSERINSECAQEQRAAEDQAGVHGQASADAGTDDPVAVGVATDAAGEDEEVFLIVVEERGDGDGVVVVGNQPGG